jgi:dephospho-CoA kinase
MADCAATHPANPFIIGLTGSIGMGKSTISNFCRKQGVPVFDADDTVYQLYSKGGAAVLPVRRLFPDAIVDGAVSRPALSKYVVGNDAAMKQLEGVVHPLVAAERLKFLKQVRYKQLLYKYMFAM